MTYAFAMSEREGRREADVRVARILPWETLIALLVIASALTLAVGVPLLLIRWTTWATLAVGILELVVPLARLRSHREVLERAVAASILLAGAIAVITALERLTS